MLPNKLQHGDNLASLFDKFNRIIDYLHETRLVAGPGMRINRLPAGTTIESTATASAAAQSVPVSGSAAQPGPFAVEIFDANEDVEDADPNLRVRLYNSAADSGTAGLVTIGSYRTSIQDQEWELQEGLVYLDVTWDTETKKYVIDFCLDNDLPETDDPMQYFLRIAEIQYDEDNDEYTVAQLRPCTDIEVLGRWV